MGLTAPAGAAPAATPNAPKAFESTLDDLRESPLFDLIPGATTDQLTRISQSRSATAHTAAPTTSSTPAVEEIARTETSATFRFTLPAGEMTREGAVLQAYWANSGFKHSDLGYLTNPVGYDGVDHSVSYSEQSIGMAMADLLRENFSISGATAVTGGVNDHLKIPAGLNSFDITVTSARTEAELRTAIEELTGSPEWNYSDASWILESRLALPYTEAWTYGERLDVVSSPPTTAQYQDGANELSAMLSSNPGNTTLTVKRWDAAPFSGDRVLRIDSSSMFGGGFLGAGGDAFLELLMGFSPPPLRPTNLTTVVAGATPVGNDFYKPHDGVAEVSATTTYDGPQTLEEARSGFTTWVTETCDAEMSDAIPGFGLNEDDEPITWQGYLDTLQEGDGSPADTQPPIYTGPEYVGSVLDAIADQNAAFRLYFAAMAGDENGMFANVVDWDAACGAAVDPGDSQVPASISVDVPSSAVAGEPITLSATVLDDDGDPVVGQQVTFTVRADETEAGTLLAAARTLAPATDDATTLTGTTGTDGVASVQYTPSVSGMLHVSASTGGSNPVSTGPVTLIPVAPAPGGGDGGDTDDDDDDTGGSGNPSGSGSLGSLFGSLGS